MTIALLLTIEDIKCQPIGTHFEIQASGVIINLTPDAAKELLSDLDFMINGIKK